MNELALFAGAGGGILGGKLLGWRTVCAVEINAYCSSVLIARKNDGILPPFPIWDDIRTFNGGEWRGLVDVVSGGFPCQDISHAKGPGAKGITGEYSGLWRDMARIVGEVRPRYVLVENSPALTFRGIDTVLADLAALRFDAAWGVFSAGDVGARHERERLWIVATNRDSDQITAMPQRRIFPPSETAIRAMSAGMSPIPDVGRKADGVAGWMDRLAAIGNGQVPQVARFAWRHLS